MEMMRKNRLLQVLTLTGKSILGAGAKQSARPQRTCRPALEVLEDRSLPSALPFLPTPNFGPGIVARAHHHHHQSVAILTPGNGAVLGTSFTLTGQVSGHGQCWPVVLVQSGGVWTAQAAVTSLAANGSFSASVSLGNAAPHTQFQVVVILAQNQHQALTMFAAGTTLNALPANLAASAVTTVTTAGGPTGGHGGGIS
jgi:hypothetical protein